MKIYIIGILASISAVAGSYFLLNDLIISAIIGASVFVPFVIYKVISNRQEGKEHEGAVAALLDKEGKHLYFKNPKLMSGDEFETYTGIIFRLLGYQVHHTSGKSSDYGIDLIAVRAKDDAKIAIQCKKYADTNVDNQVINVTDSCRKIYGCEMAAVVTTARFTLPAIMAAATCNVQLIDGDMMAELKNKIDKNSKPRIAKLGNDFKPNLAEIKPGSVYAKLLAKNKNSRSRKKKK